MLSKKPSEANPNETQTGSSSRTPPWHLWRRWALPTRPQPPPGLSSAQPTSRSQPVLPPALVTPGGLWGGSGRARQCRGRPWGGGGGPSAAGRAALPQDAGQACRPPVPSGTRACRAPTPARALPCLGAGRGGGGEGRAGPGPGHLPARRPSVSPVGTVGRGVLGRWCRRGAVPGRVGCGPRCRHGVAGARRGAESVGCSGRAR